MISILLLRPEISFYHPLYTMILIFLYLYRLYRSINMTTMMFYGIVTYYQLRLYFLSYYRKHRRRYRHPFHHRQQHYYHPRYQIIIIISR